MTSITYSLTNSIFTANVIRKDQSYEFYYPGNKTNNGTSYIVSFQPGHYSIECWGGNASLSYGGYTKGEIMFHSMTNLYFFIGPGGGHHSSIQVPMFNGGGDGDSVGGSASDIRTVNGLWNNFNSLKSRIMVAGGGGGRDCGWSIPGNGGGIQGSDGVGSSSGTGGTQTSGGIGYYEGGFGFGGGGSLFNPDGTRQDNGGGGGSGYYGGGSGTTSKSCSGGGGSSFISGHPNCNSVLDKSTVQHSNHPYHYSGYIFFNTVTISGNNTMPLPSFTSGLGNNNNGAIRVTILKSLIPQHHYFSCINQICYSNAFTIILSFFIVIIQ